MKNDPLSIFSLELKCMGLEGLNIGRIDTLVNFKEHVIFSIGSKSKIKLRRAHLVPLNGQSAADSKFLLRRHAIHLYCHVVSKGSSIKVFQTFSTRFRPKPHDEVEDVIFCQTY
ncbi:Hypothetical protein FKW44_015885 [Caligus rogercresseyi]|uniref:Uncharacterized protein n=1 Tax=Caligus rogercresseyi TaxID=217165 RepID=A0A7T8H117_CALRO|nr:Hypothetical protein FKW44_015885 [Caligus rogercresseyi]